MNLPLADRMEFGFSGPMWTAEAVRATAEIGERLDFASVWIGDHLAFAVPIAESLIQLAAAAPLTTKIKLCTGIYLLPLRHPAAVAKQVATLDRISGGRVIFGVGVGGEFPREFELVGVPVSERGARLSEGIEVLRKLWTGQPVSHDGKFYPFPEVTQAPPPVQPGGPPIWCGGRSEGALRRAGRIADGWISYVVTPKMFAESLERIAEAAKGRDFDRPYATGHMLFTRFGRSREEALEQAAHHLSVRYGMDFRRAAERYCALGRPEDVAEQIAGFHAAGVRHIVFDMIGEPEERDPQLEQFAAEVRPLLGQIA